jgi:hypothetical protein
MCDSDDELGAHCTVRSSHSGGQYESSEVYRRRGLNEPVPGVDAVDRREQESGWSGGHTNHSVESGRRRRLSDTPNSKQVSDPRRGRTEPLTIYQSKDAVEDERWVYIIKVNDNVCCACLTCCTLPIPNAPEPPHAMPILALHME